MKNIYYLISLLLILIAQWSCSNISTVKTYNYINYKNQIVSSVAIDTVMNKDLTRILPPQNYKIFDKWIIINQGTDSNYFQLDSTAYIIKGKSDTIVLIQSAGENYNVFWAIKNNQVFYDSYNYSDSFHALLVNNNLIVESYTWNLGPKVEIIKPLSNKNAFTYISLPNKKEEHIGYDVQIKRDTILYKEIR